MEYDKTILPGKSLPIVVKQTIAAGNTFESGPVDVSMHKDLSLGWKIEADSDPDARISLAIWGSVDGANKQKKHAIASELSTTSGDNSNGLGAATLQGAPYSAIWIALTETGGHAAKVSIWIKG